MLEYYWNLLDLGNFRSNHLNKQIVLSEWTEIFMGFYNGNNRENSAIDVVMILC